MILGVVGLKGPMIFFTISPLISKWPSGNTLSLVMRGKCKKLPQTMHCTGLLAISSWRAPGRSLITSGNLSWAFVRLETCKLRGACLPGMPSGQTAPSDLSFLVVLAPRVSSPKSPQNSPNILNGRWKFQKINSWRSWETLRNIRKQLPTFPTLSTYSHMMTPFSSKHSSASSFLGRSFHNGCNWVVCMLVVSNYLARALTTWFGWDQLLLALFVLHILVPTLVLLPLLWLDHINGKLSNQLNTPATLNIGMSTNPT